VEDKQGRDVTTAGTGGGESESEIDIWNPAVAGTLDKRLAKHQVARSTATLIFLLIVLVSPVSFAQSTSEFHPSWFQKPKTQTAVASCEGPRCVCGEAVLEWKDSSFRPEDTWVPRTADQLVSSWKSYDKKYSRYILSIRKFELREKKFNEGRGGHALRIKRRKEMLARDYEQVKKEACGILNAQVYLRTNYPEYKRSLENGTIKFSSLASNRLEYLRETTETSMSKLGVPRPETFLTSPIVTGAYKENRRKLPIVHKSWLKVPKGSFAEVKCTREKCTCGEATRPRRPKDPSQELIGVYRKGYLASFWRSFLASKKKAARPTKSMVRAEKLAKNLSLAGCKLKLALHFIEVLNPNLVEKIERENLESISLTAERDKCKKEQNCEQLGVLEKTHPIFASSRFHKLKDAMEMYAQSSREDHMLF
jgi:hypothetical protein